MVTTALQCWRVVDGGSSTTGAHQKFDKLPLVVQENCCLLWLNCMPRGRLNLSPNLLRNLQFCPMQRRSIVNIIHDPTINDDWHHKWLQALGSLDAGILVDHPELCHRLVKKCIMCRSWPRDLNSHMEVAHRALSEASLPLAEKCAIDCITKAHPTRWCARQPFYGTDLTEDPPCPRLRQFGILHLALRSSQPLRARAPGSLA